MGVLETAAHIVQLGGAAERAQRVAAIRASFEDRTGAFAPDDPWFDERSRAFWADTVTKAAFGREVEEALSPEERRLLRPLERAHRGLFRAEGSLLIDVWSGAQLEVTAMEDASRAEVAASGGQLFDGRVVGTDEPFEVALLPGAIFHARDATAVIPTVLAAARAGSFSRDATLDALLRMERTLRSLSRVKASYAYRAAALPRHAPTVPTRASTSKQPP